jgi:ribosome maturation protein SDO1
MAKELRPERKDAFREFVVARIEKFGESFEVLVKPEAVERIRDGQDVDLMEVLAADRVFKDAHRGTRASEEKMVEIFGTDDHLKVAVALIRDPKADIQLTTEQRRQMLEQKRKQIVAHIAANAINPQTGTPHPPQRIENAMNEAKVHIDPFKGLEEQVKEVIEAIRPLIPIRLEKARMAIRLRAEDQAKCYGDMKALGTIVQEEWQKDGGWIGIVELPAGLTGQLLDRLNEKTKGDVETKLLKE